MTRIIRAAAGAALALALGLGSPTGASAADGEAGPYLAAQLAGASSDYLAAAEWYKRASDADPENQLLLQQAAFSQILAGHVDKAITGAAALDRKDAVATVLVIADAAQKEDYQRILDELAAGRRSGPLIDGLAKAWALFGIGQVNEATTAFDELAKQAPLRPFAMYHKGLALALVGDFEGALKAMDDKATEPLQSTRRYTLAKAQILSQLERNPDAVALLEKNFGDNPAPGFADLRHRLETGKPLPFNMVETARDGISEAFYSTALVSINQTTDPETLSYARLAAFLRPADVDVTLLVATILEKTGQNDLAADAYKSISREDPAWYPAELGRADAVAAAGRTDAAIEILEALAKTAPETPDAWVRLGDMLRRADRYSEAVSAYTKGIAALGTERPEQWGIYYARGTCNERMKDWPAAEADFTHALKLNPDQPDVLNYMGYSLLERKERLDEALSMIERASKAEPDSGAITDSLGWALYRLGRTEEAVSHMERAVELMPVDPVINDHLGDVYWSVGRKREAEYQWKRALSFKPDSEEEATRIRRKLEVGLDQVLKDEGSAAPTAPVDGN